MLGLLGQPLRATAIVLTIVAVAASALWPAGGPARAQQDARYFADTGFRVDDDQIWDYFTKRGGARTFGLPTSRTFPFMGAPTQFFQRQVVQRATGGVRTLNILDDGLLPYTVINGSTFPAPDPAIASAAPKPGSAGYDKAVLEHIEKYAPNEFEGQPVRFFATFSGTVTLADAFPTGGGSEGLLPLLNLELWGQPTSKPARDPKNDNFLYLRFQRGIMHYDANCKCTQGLLLGDALKAVITGQNLPDDLAAQAADSPIFKQYDPSSHAGPLRPEAMADAEIGNAFRPSLDTAAAGPRPAASTNARTTTPAQGSPAPAQASAAQAAAPPAQAAAPTRTATAQAAAAQASGATPTATPRSGSDNDNSSNRRATATPARAVANEPTPVPGTPPDGDPKLLLIKEHRAGRDAKEVERKDGADGRQAWAWVRHERAESYRNFRSGPVVVYSKAIIAKDLDTARQIVEEEAAKNDKFPEAKKKVGGLFEFNTAAEEDVGQDAQGRSACVSSGCSEDEGEIHRRIVFRVENMVGVIYTFGVDHPEGNTQAFTRQYAQQMVRYWRG